MPTHSVLDDRIRSLVIELIESAPQPLTLSDVESKAFSQGTRGRGHRRVFADSSIAALVENASGQRRWQLLTGALAVVVFITGVAFAIAYGPRSSTRGTATHNPVSSGPSSSTGTAYVTSGSSVIPVDLATRSMGRPISVPGRVTNGIAITPDGRTAYVTTYQTSSPYLAAVVPIDLATETAGSPISVPVGIAGIAIAPDGRTAYVTTGATGEVIPIDLATRTVGSPIPVPIGRPGIAITPDGHTAYVVKNETSGQPPAIVPIDLATKTVGSPISVPSGAYSIAITPDGDTVYVVTLATPTEASSVVPIDLATKTVGSPISVPSGAYSIAIMPDGRTAYVATIGMGSAVSGTTNGGPALVPIDLATNAVGTPLAMPNSSGDIAITPSAHDLQKVLFIHTAPDGSSVTARTVNCTTNATNGSVQCGQGPSGVAGTEFDYSVDGQQYRSVVLNDDSRLNEIPQETIAPLYGTGDPVPVHTAADLIILRVGPTVADVRLARSGPGGAAPQGDQMIPVDGWVVFPIHNFINLAHPEAFDSSGKSLGTSLPFPCC